MELTDPAAKRPTDTNRARLLFDPITCVQLYVETEAWYPEELA
jgi:hypothetical protein